VKRSSRRLTLTDAGGSYVAACRRILEEVREAERSATGEYSTPRGVLNVTAPIVLGRLHVLPVASEFLLTHPDIHIGLTLTDRTSNLLEEHIDLAVRIGALPDSSMVAVRLGSVRRVVCASPRYVAERGTPLSPHDLRTHDCITFEGLAAADAWTFQVGRDGETVPVQSRLVVNTAESAIDAAVAGVGITRVLSYQVADALRAGTLTLALTSFEPPPWPVSLVYAGARLLPLKLRAFIDFAAPKLRERLQESLP
jgi:DNA-binding transcriptional LysR family regulator